MRWLVLIIAVSLALPALAGERQDAAVTAFGQCARAAARRLEPSGEDARSIARAALGACGDEENAMERALAHQHLFGPLIVQGDAAAMSELPGLERAFMNIAVETVIEIRACRRDPAACRQSPQ